MRVWCLEQGTRRRLQDTTGGFQVGYSIEVPTGSDANAIAQALSPGNEAALTAAINKYLPAGTSLTVLAMSSNVDGLIGESMPGDVSSVLASGQQDALDGLSGLSEQLTVAAAQVELGKPKALLGLGAVVLLTVTVALWKRGQRKASSGQAAAAAVE